VCCFLVVVVSIIYLVSGEGESQEKSEVDPSGLSTRYVPACLAHSCECFTSESLRVDVCVCCDG